MRTCIETVRFPLVPLFRGVAMKADHRKRILKARQRETMSFALPCLDLSGETLSKTWLYASLY